MLRKIVHVDMDAFYASIEQRDRPELKSRPVIVGGQPGSRGVVAAASYEARALGVRSAMPSSRAFKLCPDAVFVKPRFDVYKAVSLQIREIMLRHTDLVEPLSLDEAYMDVSENKMGLATATLVAKTVREQIAKETRLTASAGVAPNKFLAKIASEINKPNGQAVIVPEQVAAFVKRLPVGKIHGIGPVTERRLRDLGISTAGDLQQLSLEQLTQHFGKLGGYFYQICRGQDERPVQPDRQRKSVSAEQTFADDITDLNWLRGYLMQIAERVAERLQKNELRGRTVTLKVKFADFEQVTRSRTLDAPVNDLDTLIRVGCELLKETEAGKRKVRLLGLGVANLLDPEDGHERLILPQLPLPF